MNVAGAPQQLQAVLRFAVDAALKKKPVSLGHLRRRHPEFGGHRRRVEALTLARPRVDLELLLNLVQYPRAAGDLGQVAVLQTDKQLHERPPPCVERLPPGLLDLQKLAPLLERRFALLGRSPEHLEPQPDTRGI